MCILVRTVCLRVMPERAEAAKGEEQENWKEKYSFGGGRNGVMKP